MTNHFDATIRLLESVRIDLQDLGDEYERPTPRPHVIGQLHNTLRYDLKVGDVRSRLAMAEALHDLHNLLDERLPAAPAAVYRFDEAITPEQRDAIAAILKPAVDR